MRMRPGMLLSVVVACGGSTPAPAPAKPDPVAAKPAPASVTCDDAAVILTPDGGDAEQRTAALAEACKADHWSAEVLACVGSSHEPVGCVEDVPQHDDIAQLMNAGNDDPDVDVDADAAAAAAASLDCDQVISTVWWYPPELDDKLPERRWALDVRRRVIVEACEDGAWSGELKTCFQTATDESRPGPACLDQMEPGARDDLKKKLTEIDALAAAIDRTKKKPGSIGCKQVVAAHYGDATWKTKLDGFKPAERKKMIAESRAKMTKACNDTAWSDTLRACIVAGGGETCFQNAGMGLSWGYPAAGVAVAIGVPECDAYQATLAKLVGCDKIPQASRDALQKSSAELLSQVLAKSAKERATFAPTCKAGADAIEQAVSSLGC